MANLDVEVEAPAIKGRPSDVVRRSSLGPRSSAGALGASGKPFDAAGSRGSTLEELSENVWCAAAGPKRTAAALGSPRFAPHDHVPPCYTAPRLEFGLELADVGLDAEEESTLDDHSRKALAAARVLRARQANAIMLKKKQAWCPIHF